AGDRGSRQPLVGVLVIVLLLAIPFAYAQVGHGPRGLFLLFGATFGFVFQRSRLCLVRAFREPFMTGDGEHTRAAAVTIVVSMLGGAVFLPASSGWAAAIFLVIAVMAAWAAFATWNEASERFSLGG